MTISRFSGASHRHNKALQLTALRAAAERHAVSGTPDESQRYLFNPAAQSGCTGKMMSKGQSNGETD